MTLQPRDETTHYCKALLKKGTPIIVTDLTTGKETHTDKWRREFVDNGVTWIVEMIYVKDKKLNDSGVRVQLRVRKK
jgi:hypothetical protein